MGAFLFTATLRTRKEFLSRQSLLWLRGRTISTLRAKRRSLASAEWTLRSACHELLCSRAFLLVVLRSVQHPQIPRFLQIFRGIWPMPLALLNHSALALFAQRTRIPTSARRIGFCAIWVCISPRSHVIVLFLWAARIHGTSFGESGVGIANSLLCRLSFARYDHSILWEYTTRPVSWLHR